jgi:hypothetical protein
MFSGVLSGREVLRARLPATMWLASFRCSFGAKHGNKSWLTNFKNLPSMMQLVNSMTPEEIKKLVFYLDGLRYSFQMANLVSRRIRETLDEITRNYPDNYTEEQITSGLLDAWTLVDICYRVRELIQQTPRLSQNLPGIQIFLRGTEQVENLRHYVQHLRSGIPNIPVQSNPLWGVLSWTPTDDKTVCYTIFSGNFVGGVYGNTLTLDTHNLKFTAEMKLTADGIEIDLNAILEQLKKVKTCISEWLEQLQQPKIQQVKGKTMVLSFQYQNLKSPAAAA